MEFKASTVKQKKTGTTNTEDMSKNPGQDMSDSDKDQISEAELLRAQEEDKDKEDSEPVLKRSSITEDMEDSELELELDPDIEESDIAAIEAASIEADADLNNCVNPLTAADSCIG
ncbi:hypothetical protein H0H87_010829 [Tephrocybe sp. NHM501043]|nr:hypothetical protein H0H87_010829 [Tephrocybe sp. NHM501043]